MMSTIRALAIVLAVVAAASGCAKKAAPASMPSQIFNICEEDTATHFTNANNCTKDNPVTTEVAEPVEEEE